MPKQSTTALITGASAGLGAEFALQLARRRVNLVLVARDESKLRALADKLAAAHGIQVEVIAADLTDPLAPGRVFQRVAARGWRVDLLINNAGVGSGGDFVANDLSGEMNQVQLNVQSLVALTHLFGADMARAGGGGIIQLASIVAFVPLPRMAIYGATKAFVLSFGLAVGAELAPSGVHVLTSCPGGVATSFFQNMGTAPAMDGLDRADVVVSETLAAYKRGVAVVVPGKFMNKVLAFLTRLMPWSARLGVGRIVVKKVAVK